METRPPEVRLLLQDARELSRAQGGLAQRVTELARTLVEDGVLELHQAPGALAQALRAAGLHVDESEASTGILRVGTRPLPVLEDLTDLEPPEPLERVLTALGTLPASTVYLARLPRFPRLLLPQLEQRGIPTALVQRPDTTAILWARVP